jgi:SAM-dependent methyltransferase
MLSYYDERAAEYEQAYTAGTGTSSIADGRVFISEAEQLTDVVGRFGHGHLIDLACGSGYWLRFYGPQCSRITVIDQSRKMLAECEAKIRQLDIAERCEVIQADVLDYGFPRSAYDSALIGFLVSHLTDAQEHRLFETLRALLRPGATFLVLDSAWTDLRARFNTKTGTQSRRLNNGDQFDIYKRYLDQGDIAGWSTRYGINSHIEYFGRALFAVSGRFTA